MSDAAIRTAIIEDMIAAGVPESEFDPDFVVKMVRAMMVSYFKYGKVAEAYPIKFEAVSDVSTRLRKYKETSNKHYLVDVANFAMIEAMHPDLKRDAHWGSNDATDSPGRTKASGHRLVHETNDGSRIMGETILHHPDDK